MGIVSNQYGRDSGHIVCAVMVVYHSHTCIIGIFLGFSSHCILFYYFCRYQRLVFRHKLYELREERNMKPETFASLVSALLYEKRLVNVIQIRHIYHVVYRRYGVWLCFACQ